MFRRKRVSVWLRIQKSADAITIKRGRVGGVGGYPSVISEITDENYNTPNTPNTVFRRLRHYMRLTVWLYGVAVGHEWPTREKASAVTTNEHIHGTLLISIVGSHHGPQTPRTGLRHPSLQEGAGKRCSECAWAHDSI